MKQPSTDKQKLSKGFNKMMLSLPFFFGGPALLYFGFGHNHPLVFVLPAIFLCFLALYFAATGLKEIMDAMFNSNKTR